MEPPIKPERPAIFRTPVKFLTKEDILNIPIIECEHQKALKEYQKAMEKYEHEMGCTADAGVKFQDKRS